MYFCTVSLKLNLPPGDHEIQLRRFWVYKSESDYRSLKNSIRLFHGNFLWVSTWISFVLYSTLLWYSGL